MNNEDILFRQALGRQNDRAARMKMPDDMEQRVMERIGQRHNRSHTRIYATIGAVAACAALLVMLELWPTQDEHHPIAKKAQPVKVIANDESGTIVAQAAEKDMAQIAVVKKRSSNKQKGGDRNTTVKDKQDEQTIPAQEQMQTLHQAIDANLHYAADVTGVDNSRIPPARMDEFIKNLAEYNGVEAVALECRRDETDSLAKSTAYVFPDTKEIDVFGRLLLAAVAYEDTTPGYLLNYSHRQFFFTLRDEHLGQKHLWIAERISGSRILLYSTFSPLDAEVSSECFKEYRDKLTNTSINPKTAEL